MGEHLGGGGDRNWVCLLNAWLCDLLQVDVQPLALEDLLRHLQSLGD